MFRFQIYSLSAIILIGGAASFVGETQALLHDREQLSEAQLVAARAAADQAVSTWAADNVNRAVELASQDLVRGPLQELRQAQGQDLAKVFEQLPGRVLEPINAWREQIPGAERPDWIHVVNAEGRVVLRSNAPADRGDSIAGIPLVATMLSGAALDGVWVLDDGEYAVAAAATMSNGAIVGGVVAGFKLTSARITAIAGRLPKLPGDVEVGLALLWAGKPLGQSFVLEQGSVIPATDEPTPYGPNGLPYDPLPLLAPPLGQFLGSAAPTRGWPSQLLLAVNVPHAMEYAGVAEHQLIILAATLLLFLVSLAWGLSVRSAVSKPLALMVDHLSAVQQGGSVGVLPDVILKDPYTRLGKLINMLITRGGVAPRSSGARDDLSAVLGGQNEAIPQRTGDFNFDGISGLGASAAASSASAPVDSLPMDALQPLDEPAPDHSGIASLFDDAGPADAPPPPPARAAVSMPPPSRPPADDEVDSAAAFLASLSTGGPGSGVRPATPPPPVPPPAPRSQPPQAPPPPVHAAVAQAGWNPERTVMVQVPEELLAASASSAAPPSSHFDDYNPNPDSTVVAAIPEDLLKAAIAGPAVDPDDAHFHEVYDQFIATRKECGETISDLSYDRFLIKLHKNREQLISKYGCRTVRFQVYVKAGKAALKAVPVRD